MEIITWEEIGGLYFNKEKLQEDLPGILRWQKRFDIPQGLTKKELNKLLKETQDKINACLKKMRELGPGNNILEDIEREDYAIKKGKIKAILKLHNNIGEMNIEKAKQYPMEQLLEFKGGFARCIFHDEKTGSLKLYRERNKIHCFGCGIDADTIDVYQKINNVDFNTAVKALS